MKKLKFPTPYTVLVIVMCLAAALTYLLPAGGYDTLWYDKDKDVFVIQSADKTQEVAATKEALTSRNISIGLEKFKEQKIKNPISVPNTYKQREATPQGFLEILFAPIKGIYETVSLILFVLFIGGFIGVFNSSGALNEGVGYLAHRFKGKEGILIIVLSTLMALGGTSFGLAEETLAFYPMLVPIFLAAGYDLLVPLAVIYIGANIGSMASTTNPFAVIIASDAAGVDWTSGLTIRAIALVLCLVISIIYIIRYAEKVRKHPEKSLVYGVALPEIYATNTAEATTKLKTSTKIQLFIFALTFIVMIIGVSQWGWWFQDDRSLFGSGHSDSYTPAYRGTILYRSFPYRGERPFGSGLYHRDCQRGFFHSQRRTNIRYYPLLRYRACTRYVAYGFFTYTHVSFCCIESIYCIFFGNGSAYYAYYGGFGHCRRNRGRQGSECLSLWYGNHGIDYSYRYDTPFIDYGQYQL